VEKNKGTPWAEFPKPKSFFKKLEKWKSDLEPKVDLFDEHQNTCLRELVVKLEALCSPRREKHSHYDFQPSEVDELLTAVSKAHTAFGGNESATFLSDVDAPRPFNGESFVRALEASAEMLDVMEYVETLLVRIRALLADARMKPIIGRTSEMTLEEWLTDCIGSDGAENGCVSVLDLSLVPSEVVHIITAVIARMVFEALQRYVKLHGKALPTVLVMEEAHTFIKRYKEDLEFEDAAVVCCRVFERIAREGRKFGLGLVLSSQRPSELSPTVLSQCNTFILHRISNDNDQNLVHHLVPDNLRGLLRELPMLPSQQAILLGWAAELPVLVKIRDLPESQRPRCEDPDFWDVWTGKNEKGEPVTRVVDWKKVAEDWQQSSTERNEDQ